MDAVNIDTNEPSQAADNEPVDQHDDICRICLTTSIEMRDLFVEDDVVSLSIKLMACTNLKMIPDDGLPTQLCYDCANKLESAYELKLQAEHADNTLRGRIDKWSAKADFFFNEVEVHLNNERSVDKNYENNKSIIIKEQLSLLEVEKQQQQQQQIDCHDKNNLMEVEVELGDDHGDSNNTCKTENYNVSESITIGEHNYMVQQGYSLTNEEQDKLLEQDSNHDTTDYTVIMDENDICHQNEMIDDEQDIKNPIKLNNSGSDNNETNYFDNLNLSCRLKQANMDKKKDINKIFFMCFMCDKQFISKDILKEHMNSHEEIRNKLPIQNVPEKMMKSPLQPPLQPIKSTSSGKKLNKCPYCGKEYLYVISFKKHLKQHENSDDVIGQPSVSQLSNDQEINFNTDNDFDNTDGTFEVITDDRDENDDDDDDDDDNCAYTETLEANQVDAAEEKTTNIITTTDQATCSTNDNLNKHIILNETQSNIKINTLDNDSDLLKNSTQFNDDNNERQLENLLTTTNDNNQDDDDDSINTKINKQETIIESRLPKIKYRCKICLQEFHKKDELSSHANEHAALKNIYKCTECNKNFGNELTLRNHLIATNHRTIIQGNEYDPNKRIKRVAAKAAQKIIDKIKIESDDDDTDYNDKKPIITTSTTANLSSSEKLLLAIKNKTYNFGNNKRDIECESCGKKCSSKQYLIKHMEHHVREEKSMQQDDNKKGKKMMDTNTKEQVVKQTNWNTFNMQNDSMNTDDDEDDDDDEFDNYMSWPMDNHECPTCKKRYSTKKSLLRHQLLHDDPNYECDICHVKFYRKDKLKAHYDKCSEKNPDQVRKCNICGDIFENNEILREHRSKHVDEGILTEEDLRELEPTSDDKTNNEKIPRKRRTDIVGLECTECNKQYTSRKGLLRHIQVHEGKKYLCDICPKKFYRREHLKIHVAKHNMIKPYKCSRCSKRFIKEEQLSQHLTKHERTVKNKIKDTDSNSKRFLCEICSKSFTQSTTLVAHLRAHNGIKPFVCEVCARPFTTNAYLKMHMRTHTNEKPYTCEYCSRAFARADTLANHLTSHTGEAKYLCKYCPKKFRRLKSLKEHVFIHTGQRPYACPTCDRRFNNNGSRYAHSKRCKQNLIQSAAMVQEPNLTNIIEIQTQELPQQHQQDHQQQQQQDHQQQHHHQQLLQQQQQQQQQQQLQQQQLHDDNGDDMQLHNNSLQQQTQQIQVQIQQEPHPTHIHCTVNNTMQVVQSKGIKTITLRPDLVTSQLIQQDNNISLPYLPLTILPLTVALTDDDEVILPEGAKLFTTTQ